MTIDITIEEKEAQISEKIKDNEAKIVKLREKKITNGRFNGVNNTDFSIFIGKTNHDLFDFLKTIVEKKHIYDLTFSLLEDNLPKDFPRFMIERSRGEAVSFEALVSDINVAIEINKLTAQNKRFANAIKDLTKHYSSDKKTEIEVKAILKEINSIEDL